MGTNLNALVLIHSYLRWAVLLTILMVVIICISGWRDQTKRVGRKDQRVAFWMTLFADLMALIGIIIWVLGEKGYAFIQSYGMSEVMKSAPLRFHAIEHPIGMLAGIILLHVSKSILGKSYMKKSEGSNAYKKAFFITLIGLVIILASVPWPWREIVGRPLLPM